MWVPGTKPRAYRFTFFPGIINVLMGICVIFIFIFVFLKNLIHSDLGICKLSETSGLWYSHIREWKHTSTSILKVSDVKAVISWQDVG